MPMHMETLKSGFIILFFEISEKCILLYYIHYKQLTTFVAVTVHRSESQINIVSVPKILVIKVPNCTQFYKIVATSIVSL